MIRKRSIKPIFLFLIINISFLQTGCQKERAASYRIPGDGGLISQEPCGPPCFYGITPGITNKEEAEDIFINSLQLGNCIEHEVDGPGGTLSCDGLPFINFDEANLVTGITYYLGKEVAVNELIQEYGEPISVSTITEGIHKDFKTVMRFYYPEIGMTILLVKQEGSSFNISPETTIDLITYSTYYTRLENNPFIQEWKGYGEYFMGTSP